jgi:hypothetical protein
MVTGTPSMSERRLAPFFQRFSEARAARRARIEGFDARDGGAHGFDRRGLARLVKLHELVGGHHRQVGSHGLISRRMGNFNGWASA